LQDVVSGSTSHVSVAGTCGVIKRVTTRLTYLLSHVGSLLMVASRSIRTQRDPGPHLATPPLGERGLLCRHVTLHRRVAVPVNGGFHRHGLSADCVQPAPSLRRRVHCTLLVTARFHSAALVPRSMSVASPIVQFFKNSDTTRFRNCTRHGGQTQVRYPIPIIRTGK